MPPFTSGGFALAVLRRVNWHAVAAMQFLGVLFAVSYWLEDWQQPDRSSLVLRLMQQATEALLVMLAAFAGDEAVRRGWSVWRAFVVVLLCASAVNILVQGLLRTVSAVASSGGSLAVTLNSFLMVGGVWGTAMLVYLNRQSARRLLGRLRADELERVQAERRLAASRLAAAEAQIDPASVLRQLAAVRDLFAAGRQEADEQLDVLINGLREMVSRDAAGRREQHI